jgi:tyrosine-protein phosphatase YwqE
MSGGTWCRGNVGTQMRALRDQLFVGSLVHYAASALHSHSQRCPTWYGSGRLVGPIWHVVVVF